MNHAELVEIGYNWLMKHVKCSFALKELTTHAPETPDVIGWKNGDSILIECKTSRADFLADQKKDFRLWPVQGAGNYRFYLTNQGLLGDADIPEKWGWLEVSEEGEIIKRIAPKGNIWTNFPRFHEVNLLAERVMLCSALRRIQNKTDIQEYL